MARLILVLAMLSVIVTNGGSPAVDTVLGQEIIPGNDFTMSEREECLKECRFKYGSGFSMDRWMRVKNWKYAQCVRECEEKYPL